LAAVAVPPLAQLTCKAEVECPRHVICSVKLEEEAVPEKPNQLPRKPLDVSSGAKAGGTKDLPTPTGMLPPHAH